MEQQNLLIETLQSYQPDVDTDLIIKAIDYAKDKHDGQFRSSGEPYYTHPVAVAQILAEMKMDVTTIVTAILHDTVEDTDATLEDLTEHFGKVVSDLVNGVSKLSRIESQTVEGKQAENFRKLLLAMSEDIRVLIVKLGDRLHNMRTMGGVKKPEKRRRVSLETLEIYVPLAERIGIHTLKEELEDLCFEQINAEARAIITRRLEYLRKEGGDLVDEIIVELNKVFKKHDLDVSITGREKTRYSIWKKMQRKNVSFEQLSDIMAFRVLVDKPEDCYLALGIVHSKYRSTPGRFKDYISTPKPNGYRSIHTTIMGPKSQRIEIQIRTRDMHAEAELGVAAHWAYKGGGAQPTDGDVTKYRWLRDLLDILEQEQRPEEFWESTKMELFQDRVFVFTPKGDLYDLPSGATPIDFAYKLHSDIGDHCAGAKINGRIAPINTRLVNGDQVELTTSKSQKPSERWLSFIVTGRARSRIHKFLRDNERDEFLIMGKERIKKVFRNEGYDFTEKAITGVLSQFSKKDNDDLYVDIGASNLDPRDVFKAIFPAHQSETDRRPSEDMERAINNANSVAKRSDRDKPLPIKGLVPGMAMHFGRCCHPLPGDRIVGIVITGKGVAIHRIDCETLETFADTPERWLDVSWDDQDGDGDSRNGRLDVTITNEPGTLGAISTVIARSGGNIGHLKVTNRSLEFWDMLVEVKVNDTKHLNNVIAALRATECVVTVDRSRGR